MIAITAVLLSVAAISADDSPAVARFDLQGPVGDLTARVTRHWLLEAPDANPAILAMFRDRDRKPFRDLLPWSGEFAGKYLTSATQVLRIREDQALRDRLQRFVDELVQLQDQDGYLGPFPRDHRLTGTAPNVGPNGGPTWDAWGHYHLMLGLLLWHRETGDPSALAAATRIGDLLRDRFLGDKQPRLVDTGSTEMNLAPAHGLLLLHEATRDPRHRSLAEQIVREFAAEDPQGKPLAGDYLRRGTANQPFFQTPKPRWESLHPILALAELARLDPAGPYKEAFSNLWWSIVERDRHNNGGFSSGEQATGNPYHPGAIETCCTIAWMALSADMLRLTQNPVVADELELSTLNSGLGMFSPTGRWSTYNTPMDGDRKANFHEINFQCRPGSPELNCCSVNAARGLGLIGEWAVLRDDAGLFLNYYGPGTITARLTDGRLVGIRQETDYPRNGVVRIVVEPEKPGSFAIRLRVPAWSSRTTARLNGEPIADPKPGTYLVLQRDWKAGDRIDLDLDFRPRAWAGEREAAGKASIYRGPLLLAHDPRFGGPDPSEAPALDAARLTLTPVPWAGGQPPILLVEARSADGQPAVRLCDFASAGFDGSPYRTWLPVEDVPSTPFRRESPGRTAPASPPTPR